MPHKHRRDKSKNPSSHDLPPTSRALPLPVGKLPHDTTKSHPLSLKDDTPRAFTRLMTFTSTDHKTPRGLDDGLAPKSAKKRKRDPSDPAPEPPAHRNNADQATTTTSTTVAAAATITAPKILPSERLSDFAARVDQAIPVSGLVKNRGRGPGDKQTRMEKRMQRMQQQWREEEERRRQKREEEQREHEEEGGWADEEYWGTAGKRRKKRRGKGKGKGRGGSNNNNSSTLSEDEDPWAVVAVKREREREEREGRDGKAKGGLVGLHDVVMEPLKVTKVPKERGGGANVKVLGGLKRQEELKEARRKVVEGYRKMMSERKGDGFLKVGSIA